MSRKPLLELILYGITAALIAESVWREFRTTAQEFIELVTKGADGA